MNKSGKLYVLPNILSPDNLETLSLEAVELLETLRFFAVENVKTVRRTIRAFGIDTDFSTCTFFTIHHKTEVNELEQQYALVIDALENGHDVGILSDAGMAGIADPGSDLVFRAHQNNIPVRPIVGPSSLFLALAASGLNGQQFQFKGYLPIEARSRRHAIQEMERESIRSGSSQLFMETPYRNNALFKAVVEHCRPDTYLCVASQLTSANEYIQCQPIDYWQSKKIDLNKKPTIFIIGRK